MANNQDRSKVILINPHAKTGDYKRSAHDDFATTSELKQREFTGWRENKILEKFELWIKGGIVREVSFVAVMMDKDALEKVFAEFTGVI